MNIKDNPFYILGASPRDSKQILHEKAEDKAFELPEDICRNAERMLLNPQRRLEAEVSWLPGISPNRVRVMLDIIKKDYVNKSITKDSFNARSLNDLARINLLTFYLNNVCESVSWNQSDIEDIVYYYCQSASDIDADMAFTLINDDRIASGFPELIDKKELLYQIEANQEYYQKTLFLFLNKAESQVIVNVLTNILESVTSNGDQACRFPILNGIVAEYEIYASLFFDKQEKKIINDLYSIKNEMEQKRRPDCFQATINDLKKDVLLWDRIAQPIQVLEKSKGVDHQRSKELSERLREFALSAHNEYGYTDVSLQITNLQQNVFAELRTATEIITEDKKQLQKIMKQKEIQKEKDIAFKREMEYYSEWGTLFKKSIKMDSEIIIINGSDRFYLNEITGLMWGGTRTSVNGIPTGTIYTIALRTENREASIQIKKVDVFDNIVQRLWKTSGVFIMTSILERLKNGFGVPLGKIYVYNDRIELTRKSLFSSETKKIEWAYVEQPFASNGSLVIRSKDGMYCNLIDYNNTYNTHIFDYIFKVLFSNRSFRTISEAFEREE